MIEEFKECQNIEQLRQKERPFIDSLNCINKQLPTQSKREWDKKYKKKNQSSNEYNEKIHNYNRQYYGKNKKEILKKRKTYYQANKNEILKNYKIQKKTTFTCECGKTLTLHHKKRYNQSLHHQNFLAQLKK